MLITQVKNPAVAFMRICTERSCTDLIDSEDKTLVFNPAKTVYFYIAGDNAQFDIQYYGESNRPLLCNRALGLQLN